MKKVLSLLLCIVIVFCAIIMSSERTFGLSTEPNSLEEKMIESFDFSKYHKEDLENLLKYLEKVQEKPELFFICKCIEAEITDSLNNAQEEGERVHHLQILEQKIQHALEHERNLIKRNYEKLFDFIREDLIEYKTLIKSKQEEKEAIELLKFRKEQIDWSSKFLKIFKPNEPIKWKEKDFTIESIDIYEFFDDGEYCAPVQEHDLTMINRSYENGHYGIDINIEEGTEILSIANNAVVLKEENKIILMLNSGTKIIYENITSDLNTNDIVNKGDVIGYYKQENNNYNGLYFSIVKKGKEYSPVWIMRKLPFITEKGMSMPLYIQFDPRWGAENFGGSRIGSSACGPSAMAMCFSYLKNEVITPPDLVNAIGGGYGYYIKGVGSTYSIIDKAVETYGLQCKRIEYDEIIDELNSGHPIVACMGPGTFTQAGHFIALSGVAENGEIYVNDSADDIYKRHYEKTFSLSLIRAQGRAFWAIYNADEIIE